MSLLSPLYFFIYFVPKKRNIKKKVLVLMGVVPLNSVDSVTGVVPRRTFKNQTNNNALRPALKPIRSRIFANGHHLRWASNFFRGLA